MLLSICACGASGGKTTEADKQATDYEVQTAIKKQIEDTPIPKGYATLLDDVDNWVTVQVKDGEATVTIRAFMNYTIPYTAELFLPIAQQAADDAGVTLTRFSVSSYNTNKDGVVDGTMADWSTSDGVKGTLADTLTGENVVKPNSTLEQVYEYYADYESIVKGMIEEAGGTFK